MSVDAAITIPDRLTFSPTREQKRVRAALMSYLRESPMADPSAMTSMDVQSVTGSASVAKWWSDPVFRSWLLNPHGDRIRIEALFSRWLDRTEEALEDPEVSTKDLVNLGKVLMELADRGPKKIEYVDKQVGSMSEAQLRVFIAKHYPGTPPISILPSPPQNPGERADEQ